MPFGLIARLRLHRRPAVMIAAGLIAVQALLAGFGIAQAALILTPGVADFAVICHGGGGGRFPGDGAGRARSALLLRILHRRRAGDLARAAARAAGPPRPCCRGTVLAGGLDPDCPARGARRILAGASEPRLNRSRRGPPCGRASHCRSRR